MWLHRKPTHRQTQRTSHRRLVVSLLQCSQGLTDNPDMSTESEKDRKSHLKKIAKLNYTVYMTVCVCGLPEPCCTQKQE